MRIFLTLFAGISIGIGLAVMLGKAQRQYVRVDSVTLKRSDLDHVTRAIELLKDKPVDRSYTRYEADSGSMAFDCPTAEACNLEVPAREREKPRELTVTMTSSVETSSPEVRGLSEIESEQSLAESESVPEQAEAKGLLLMGGNVYDQIGLKNGDVITSINGKEVKSPSSALEQLQQFVKSREQLNEVTILRNGHKIRVSLNERK